MRSVFRFLASGVLVGLLVAAVCGQASQTGGLTGVVTDKAGAVVAGATVDVVNDATARSVRTMTTGDDGGFSVNLLPPATYHVEVSAPNFKKAVISGVRITIGATVRQDVSLEAGRIEEVVNVEAAPTLINSSSAVTGQGLDAQVEDLHQMWIAAGAASRN